MKGSSAAEIEARRNQVLLDIEQKKAEIDIRNQRIIELFICGNDRRQKIIASTIGVSEMTVSNTIQSYFEGKITFDRGECLILHSAINYIEN
jgi:DNA-directed RNA polymerase specialized sigma subunit